MDIAARSLDTKRTVITQLMQAGLYPYTKRYLGTFDNHFSTIGLVGMNEAALNAHWVGENLTHKDAQQFAKNVLNHMRNRLVQYQEKYGALFNLEATPAESTTYRLAKHDKKRYPHIITAAAEGKAPYYTNSSHLPVGATDDIFEALSIQDDLQVLYTSGTVFHAYLGEKLPDWKAAAALVRKIAENYKLPYYTISPTYSVCEKDGYIAGEHKTCPTCGKDAEVYSRITGYYRPVRNWNDGKAQEFLDRKEYVVEEAAGQKDQLLLFTTPTCASCAMVKKQLAQAGIAYTLINAAEHQDLVERYAVQQAPSLVAITKAGKQKFSGAAKVMEYIKEHAAEHNPA